MNEQMTHILVCKNIEFECVCVCVHVSGDNIQRSLFSIIVGLGHGTQGH